MPKAVLAVAALLSVCVACRGGPVGPVAGSEAAAVEAPPSVQMGADVARVTQLAQDEFLRDVVLGVEDEALAGAMTRALRDLAYAAGTGDPRSVWRAVDAHRRGVFRERPIGLSPADESALSVFEIALDYADWWITVGPPNESPTGPPIEGNDQEIER